MRYFLGKICPFLKKYLDLFQVDDRVGPFNPEIGLFGVFKLVYRRKLN